MSDQPVHNSGSDSTRPSLREQPTGDSRHDERLGADADDAILARAALVGQTWAQREIWFRFAPMVYRFFRRTLGPRYDRDDLTQDVFLRIFRNLHALEKASSIRSFVYSVAVRIASEEVRRFAWRRRIIERKPVIFEPSTSPPADFEMREAVLCVQRSLDRMRDSYRAVFILRYVEGMDSKISAGLGISRATVKRHLAKALAFIQKSVLQEGRRRRCVCSTVDDDKRAVSDEG